MQNANDCLEKAMFIASESYSGSTYEMGLFQAMDELCDETIIMIPESAAATAPAIAA
jgi:hypothetical protein